MSEIPDQIIPLVDTQKEKTTRELLGSGGFGKVFKLLNPIDNKTYAVKRIPLRKKTWNYALTEIRLLAQMDHPHIVRYYHSWMESDTVSGENDSESENDDDDDDGVVEHFGKRYSFYIQMEYCLTSLRSFLDHQSAPLETTMIHTIFQQIVYGLSYLHQQCVIHQDIKPENILIQSFNPFFIKISDFGLAQIMEKTTTFLKRTLYRGTFLYASPEQYTKGIITYSTDVYSLGVVLYELGFCFHTESERYSVLKKIKSGDVCTSHPFFDCVVQMTRPDPNQRPSLSEFCSHDNHYVSGVYVFCRDIVWEIVFHAMSGL
jgi:serine/threonine protein kinase